jgi:predicted dithiol-disulfide oxidoreductase (DUF899 family)
MILPLVVSHVEWRAARRRLLAREKEATRLRDALAAQRRQLPGVRVVHPYVFAGPTGPKTLLELFAGRRQLIIYHFMFDPEWEEGCKGCAHLADSVDGILVHLAARDTSFVAISRAPLERIEPYRRRMGWSFPWLSSYGSSFNYDFHVTLDEDADAEYEHNFTSAAELLKGGKIPAGRGEMPGLSVFLREGSDVYHTYSTYQRGLDALLGTYTLLDLTPLGRQETDGEPTLSWLRHHDRYGS